MCAPVRAQHCSDCFVPQPAFAPVAEAAASASTSPAARRSPRAQAGDVTALSITALSGALAPTLPREVDALMGPAGPRRTEAYATVVGHLTTAGLPSETAHGLATAVTGLLAGEGADGRAAVTAYNKAVTAYNEAVHAAPAAFLEAPPSSFRAVRAVLLPVEALGGATRPAPDPRRAALLLGGPRPERPGRLVRPRRSQPSSTINTPTAFGPGWGEVFAGVSYQHRLRYTDWRDGILAVGGGLGNPHRTVGLAVTVSVLDTYTDFGQDRSLSLKLHRRLPLRSAVAVGYENVWHTDGTDGGDSRFGVASIVIPVRIDLAAPLGSIVLSGGLGEDRFLPEDRFARGEKGTGVFGSAGIRLHRVANGVVNWSGQDLNLGLSVAPHRAWPVVVTPALLDVTGRAGDGARFAVSASVGYNARR